MLTDGDYVVEVRAHTEGGDGAVAQIQITGNRLHHLLHDPCLLPYQNKLLVLKIFSPLHYYSMEKTHFIE